MIRLTIEKAELGRRLRQAREATGLTQEAAATQLGLSRGALAQFETGVKVPNSLHLARLAEIYRRELAELLADDFDERMRDPLTALFRADPQLAGDSERAAAVADCAKLCREYTNLEKLLGVDQDRAYSVRYNTPLMRTRWDAIRQGERLAEVERARLKLGDDPIGNLAEMLQAQGLRFVEMPLPENISGLFLLDGTYGPSIFVNEDDSLRRRAFSCCHEYCHLLADWDRGGSVSRAEDREQLPEVRANAFAAAFLMPEGGVRTFVRRLGKGEPSRSHLQAYDEREAVEGQKRQEPHSQDVQVYDIAQVAHYFGVSYEMALYRLLNLKLITDEERARLAERRDANGAIRFLEAGAGTRTAEPKPFRYQLVLLALEAFRRELISRSKFKEIARLARVSSRELESLVEPIEKEFQKTPNGRAAHVPKA